MKKVITTLGAGALALTLAACSDSAETAGVTDTTASESIAATENTEEETSAAEVSPAADDAPEAAGADLAVGDISQSIGGSYEATLDGAEVTVDEELVACQEVNGQTILTVGPTAPSPDVQSISVTLNEDGSVATVAMGSTTGRNLAYAPGSGGEATATVDGNSYNITGSGLVADMNDITAMPETKPFDVTITCE